MPLNKGSEHLIGVNYIYLDVTVLDYKGMCIHSCTLYTVFLIMMGNILKANILDYVNDTDYKILFV